MGIPSECHMDCYEANVPSDGKPAADPAQFSSNTMLGGWTNHAYKMSHDGSTMLVWTFEGFQIQKGGQKSDYKIPIVNHELFWSPDSSKFAFWSPDGLAVCDLAMIGPPGGAPVYKPVYKPAAGRFPFGMEWSPYGTDLYVLENVNEFVKQKRNTGSAIKRVPASGGTPKEIVFHPTPINFFMPPVSRYENGGGTSNRPYLIVFGAPDGLFVVDRDGKKQERLTDVPGVGLQNLEWSPATKEKICLFFRRPEPNAKGEVMSGVYLIHMDRRDAAEKDQKSIFESLYPGLDVHTLWFSGKGKYVTWATGDAVYFREPDAKPDSLVKIEPKDERGLFLEVKGCAWDHGETKLAICAGNKLLVYDTTKKTLSTITTFGKQDGKSFAAEPAWRGDNVVCTVFTDVGGAHEHEKKKGK